LADWRTMEATISIPIGELYIDPEEVIKRFAWAKECQIHELNYPLFSKPYRRYRRGKNRCPRCGLKIG